MKTFQEFLYITDLIVEKYYKPDEKLPSGKTPVEKTENKIKNTPDTPQTPNKTRARRIELKRKLERKVKHGADNPEVNAHQDSGVRVYQSHDKKHTEIDHPHSGIYYEIIKKPKVNGKDHHEINWHLDRTPKPEEKRKLAHAAKQIYDKHVQHRLPRGTIVSNQPATPTHEKIYKRYGFGKTGVYGNRQFASVEREPSPKQKAKGKKTRLKPIDDFDESFDYSLIIEAIRRSKRKSSSPLINSALTRMPRNARTVAAISRKAGLRGTGKLSTYDLRTRPTNYTTYDSKDELDDIGSKEHDHFILSYKSPRKAAFGERLINKRKISRRPESESHSKGLTQLKVAPSSESVRRVKHLKNQMRKSGANKKGSVHIVNIMHRDMNLGKNDKTDQIERGRSFVKAIKDTPKHLKDAGAKKGDTILGRPSAVFHGEDEKKGVEKRAKLYKNVLGKKAGERSHVTGYMAGKME